jgi:type II secretory pathway pseudopilin PulG
MRLNNKKPFQFGQVYWLQVEDCMLQVDCGAPSEPANCKIQPSTQPKARLSLALWARRPRRQERGHTLAEVMVSVGLLGIMVVSLFAGFSSGFDVVRASRENVRATQILEERMEVIRLIKWDNVTLGFIPTNFTVPFYAVVGTNTTASGLTYTGTVSFPDTGMSETYSTNLRTIQIALTWTSGSVTHKREMTTYVSKYGMQNYIY